MKRRALLRGAVLALALRPFKDLVAPEVAEEPEWEHDLYYESLPVRTDVDLGGIVMVDCHFSTGSWPHGPQ